MKIALVHRKFTTYGGTERNVVNLARGLVAKGHEVHVFCNRWDNTLAAEVVFHKIPAIKLGRAFKTLSFAYFAERRLQKEHFDIIHGFGKTFKHDVYRCGGGCHIEFERETLKKIKNPFLRKIRYFLMLLSPYHWAALYIEGRIFAQRGREKIIAVSKNVRNQVVKNYHIPEKEISIIYNGVDAEAFASSPTSRADLRRAFGISDDDIVIIFTATNFQLKGFENLLRAYKAINDRYRNQRFKKLFAIGGSNHNKFKQLASELGIAGSVEFTGTKKNLHDYYSAGDLFVYPTLYDPFSNVCLEAMAGGLPVITSRLNGFSEIIEDGVDGLIINDPLDINEIADKISMLSNNDLRSKIAHKARETAQKYTLNSNFDAVLDIYKEILDKRKIGKI